MPRNKKSPEPVLKPRFRIRRGADVPLGPGKAELLGLIGETGSIAEAARRMEMSYMRAWTLLKQMERSFREPLLHRQRGGSKRGGARLTPFGARVLSLYQAMELEAIKATEKIWGELRSLLRE